MARHNDTTPDHAAPDATRPGFRSYSGDERARLRAALTDLGGNRPDDPAPPRPGDRTRSRFPGAAIVLGLALAGGAGWTFGPDFDAYLSKTGKRLPDAADLPSAAATRSAEAEPADAPAAGTAARDHEDESLSGGPVLEASGKVVARREATLSSDLTGRLMDLRVAEGDRVAAGEVVALLDARSAEAQIAISEANMAVARQDAVVVEAERSALDEELARIETLAQSGVASAQALDTLRGKHAVLTARHTVAERQIEVQSRQLDAMRSDLEKTRIRTPFGGIVTEITANPGEIVSPVSSGGYTQTGIATILDPGSIVGEVSVNEQFVGKLAPGQPVEMTVPAWPERVFTGHVTLVTPVVDESTAAVKVTVGFEPVPDAVFPGMRLDVSFLEPGGQQDS